MSLELWRKRHREMGLCVECNRPAVKSRCQYHLDENAKFQMRTRVKKTIRGLCPCGEKVFKKYSLCEKHLLYKRKSSHEKYLRYIKDRKCTHCGTELLEFEKTRCMNCVHSRPERPDYSAVMKRRNKSAAYIDSLMP